MDNQPIFFDPEGKRTRRLSRIAVVFSAIAAVVTTIFVLSLLAIPAIPGQASARRGNWIPGMPDAKNRRQPLTGKARKELMADVDRTKTHFRNPPKSVNRIVAAFYAPYQETGINSLRTYVSALTHVIPEWLHLSRTGLSVDEQDFDLSANPTNAEVIKLAREHGIRITPLLNNGENGLFDPARVHKLFETKDSQVAMVKWLAKWLKDRNFDGLNLDFEQLSASDSAKLPGFLKLLRDEFQPLGLELSIDLEVQSTLDLEAALPQVDYAVWMAYDEHSEESEPGPIASFNWCQEVLRTAARKIPADKLVLGIGSYAYDWTHGIVGAEAITYQEALAAAKGYRVGENPADVIKFEPSSLNSTFTYRDDNDDRHEVWILDAASAYNQWIASESVPMRGMALWSLGSEDPGIWTFFDKRRGYASKDPAKLRSVEFPQEVDRRGRGEILKVVATPQRGSRTVETDASTGLITGFRYRDFPLPYVIQQSGYIHNKLAITFDDGPDSAYTGKVLDALKRLNVPATFFVVGRNAEEHPNLVRRIFDEGHEIGSHSFTHPNMGTVNERRAELELNATQRALEGILDRSTILFRPPFNADAEPSTADEVRPVALSSRMNYVTVGEKIDPQDWNLSVPLPGGGTRPKTAQDIASVIIDQTLSASQTNTEGNILLLHDAGGNRDETIKSLDIFIPKLQKAGFEFVSVSKLMGKTRDQVMPPISGQERMLVWADRVVFGFVFTGEAILALAFISAIGLGLARIALVTPLAIIQARLQRKLIYSADFRPPVTALIAAFNEETVILQTVQSVLDSDYPLAEVIVVDDGSSDGTAKVLHDAYRGDPRVRVIKQSNGGKASALNNGLLEAGSEFLFCIDADTQLAPDAVSKLVRHFADDKVCAVAGNVRVGNMVNILTRWQSVEYTTSQNIDRRAYALLNAITVVPGAIGAWRRSAVVEVGAYQTDTLAEDMDLTWRLRRAGYRLANEPDAFAYTEAPETFGAFFKQRFRWAYGTLQCLWKHRRAVGHNGWFGWLALPSLWLFQIIFQAIAPLVDLQIILALTFFVISWVGDRGQENSSVPGSSQALQQIAFLYAVFFLAELVAGLVAYRLDRTKATPLWWLFLQRFAYRQIMYGVVYKSFRRALKGTRQGWGKLDRKGTVAVPPDKA